MRRHSGALVGVLVVLLTLTALGQEPQAPKPTFESGTELVAVDVTVLGRDGAPLTELKPEDFTVKVDGQPRTVASLRLIRADEAVPGATPGTPLPASQAAADARLFIIVVDRDHIPAGEGRQMLDAATRFVDALPPNDRIALWTIPAASGAFRFATDRAALKKEIRSAVGTYRPPLLGGLPGRAQFNIAPTDSTRMSR